MSNATAAVAGSPDGASSTPPFRKADPSVGVTLRRVMRSEWIKLRSVRSILIGLLAAAIVAVALGMILSSVAGSGGGPGGGPGSGPGNGNSDPVSLSLQGFNIAQLIIGVLGVLVVTSEYSTGMIRTTFAAVTRRVMVLEAKAVVFGCVTLVVMSVVAFVAFFGGQAVYGGSHAVPSITDPDVLRAVLGTACYTTAVGLIGVALGFLLRSTAAAIGVLVASVIVIPGLAGLLPGTFGDTVSKLLPSNAGSAFTSVSPGSSLLSPVMGALVLVVWVGGLLIAAALVVRRRDA